MAWAVKIKSGSWRGIYRDGTGKTVTAQGGPFRHKPEALRVASEEERVSRERHALNQPDPRNCPVLEEWCPVWLGRRRVDASTQRTDIGRVNRYLLPKWGDVPLNGITRGEIRAWVNELKAPRENGKVLSDSTVQRIVHLLSSALDHAIEDNLITNNPARGLKLRIADNSRETYLTADQFWAVYDSIDETYQDAIHLLAFTGIRLGEAIGLHRARIHPGTGLIEVREAWDDKTRVIKAYPKGKQRRFVALPEWVAERPLASKRGETCGQHHVEGKCPGGFFLHSPEGSVMDPSKLRKAFELACSQNGLEGVRIHDLRHTYASWLLQDGVSLAEVGRALGHKSPQTTARYAHLSETPKGQILAALPSRPGAQQPARGLRLVK